MMPDTRRSPHSFSCKRLLLRQPFWHGPSLSQMPRGRRPHHHTNRFYWSLLTSAPVLDSTIPTS
jgi:hypothetical protein